MTASLTNKTLRYNTKGLYHTIDITDEVKAFVRESGIRNGRVNIQTLHTTATVFMPVFKSVDEKKEDFIKSIKNLLELIAPSASDIYYEHDDFAIRYENMCDNECKNGHSHLKASWLPVNVPLNLINGQLQIKPEQKIFFMELDRQRPRKAQINIVNSNNEYKKTLHIIDTPHYDPGGPKNPNSPYRFNDMTSAVIDIVKKSGIKQGHVIIQSLNNNTSELGTASVFVNERERGSTNDFKRFLGKIEEDADLIEHIKKVMKRIVPTHLNSSLLPARVTLNLINGKLQLGQWQRIFSLVLGKKNMKDVQIIIKGE